MELETLYTVEAHEEGAEMRVKDPQGNDTDFYITLIGVDSKKWKGLYASLLKKMVDDELDQDEEESKIFAMATLDWKGLTKAGKAVEFSTDKAKDLYLNAPYIRKQADTFIANRANFMQGKEAQSQSSPVGLFGYMGMTKAEGLPDLKK